MTQVVPNTQSLYSILCKGDRKIDRAYQSAIILVGLTRVGKSTVYNWLLGKQMIGAGTNIRPFYNNVINLDTENAQIKESIVSVTLAPNIHPYDQDQLVSLIDMAGFLDKRNYKGVYGVSYFLKSVFEKVKRAKFILVLDETSLELNTGQGIMRTFSGFLNMFDLKKIKQNPEALENFYSSISLCVTKSLRPELHIDYLKDICQQMRNAALVTENREEIIEVLDYLTNKSNLVEQFKKAKFNEPPEPCNLVENLNKKDWSYFQIKQNYIQIPFQKEFEKLPDSQQTQFKSDIKSRLNSFLEFSKILKKLYQSVKSRWASIINDWNQNRVLDLEFSYAEVFQQIAQYLNKNDYYKSQTIVKPQFRIEYKKLNLISIIKTIQEIYTILALIAEQTNLYETKFARYSELYVSMIEIIRRFCLNQEEESLIQRLKFVVNRGFREFSKLHQMQQDLVSDLKYQMRDKCNGVFQEQPIFIQGFINYIDYQILCRMFSNIQGLTQYENFFNKFQTDFKGTQFCSFNDFKQHRKNINLCKGNIYDKNQNKPLALKYYLKVAICLAEIREELKDQQKLDENFLERLLTIGFITNILKKLPVVENSKSYALRICIDNDIINEACEIYEMLITQAGQKDKKIQLYNEFVEHCLKWGRFDQANTILQKKLELQRQSMVNYKGTISRIIEITKMMKKNGQPSQANSTSYIDDYIKNMENLLKKTNEADPSLSVYEQLIQKIEE